MAIVLNSAVDVYTVRAVFDAIDLPIIYTVISDYQELDEYIEAGANAITYTPPTTQAVFQNNMNNYRVDLKEDYEENHP